MHSPFELFNPVRLWKSGDPNPQLVVEIVLAGTSLLAADRVSFTPTLATDSEIDDAVNLLRDDLERLRVEAKRALVAQREWVRARRQ